MTKTRNLFMQCFAWGVAALAIVLGTAGCAASDAPRTDASAGQQRAVEVDLTGAHLDKHKFLIGVSMLGESPERDKELLHKITGKVFEPKPYEGTLPPGVQSFSIVQNLQHSPMLTIGGYGYRISNEGGYRPRINLEIERNAVCISVEDVTAVMGPPTRVSKTYEMPHRMRGPTDIAAIVYIRHSNMRLVFGYNAGHCAYSVALLPDQK